jgi:hypothetical protein
MRKFKFQKPQSDYLIFFIKNQFVENVFLRPVSHPVFYLNFVKVSNKTGKSN